MDLYVIILFVTLCIVAIPWENGILVILGDEPFTHLFLATFLVINGVFFSFGLFLTSFDLKNYTEFDFKKVAIYNKYLYKFSNINLKIM